MRLFRSVLLVVFVTLTALVYVHQQVELVKLSYAIECKEKCLKDVLDRRESLGYNIDNLESPFRLEKVLLSRNIDVTFPKRGHIVGATKVASRPSSGDRIRSALSDARMGFLGFLDFFSPKAEAQAKEK